MTDTATKASRVQTHSAVPMREPVECDRCGEVMERRQVDESRALTLRALGQLQPSRDEPGADVDVCPSCGAYASFQCALTCAECLEYPCICMPLCVVCGELCATEAQAMECAERDRAQLAAPRETRNLNLCGEHD